MSDHDAAVREMAETLVREVDRELDYERWPVSLVADRISTFLAEREAGWLERQDRSATTQLKMVGRLATLRGALERIGNEPPPGIEEDEGWARAGIIARAALAPGAGKAEAEFIQAALDFHDSSDPMDETEKRFHDAADALRAARGGEG